MNGKGEMVLLENGNRSNLLRAVLHHPRLVNGVLLMPKRYIALKDGYTCLVARYRAKGFSGYGALSTKVIHRFNIKSVLRRAGVR